MDPWLFARRVIGEKNLDFLFVRGGERGICEVFYFIFMKPLRTSYGLIFSHFPLRRSW